MIWKLLCKIGLHENYIRAIIEGVPFYGCRRKGCKYE